MPDKPSLLSVQNWPNGLIYVCRIVFILALSFVTWQSLSPATTMPSVTHIDKLFHLLAYMGLGILALLSGFVSRAIWPIAGIIIFGLLIEIAQGILDIGRTASLADAAANTIGAVIAYGVYRYFSLSEKR